MCTSSAEILREFLLSSHRCAAVPALVILPGAPAINPVQQDLAVTEFTQIRKKILQKDAARKKIARDEQPEEIRKKFLLKDAAKKKISISRAKEKATSS